MGDKQILRRLAQTIGLSTAQGLVKRAMQFGTRIANRRVGGEAGAAGAGTAAMGHMLLVPKYEPTPESFSFLWGGGNVGVGAK